MKSNRPLILLIDDNEHGLVARRAVLEERGFLVETACDGEAGLALFAQAEFDVVVTDYRMPGICGRQVLATIRETHPRTPVVILSGYVSALGLDRELDDADAVLTKGPSEHDDLVRTVSRLVKRKPRADRSPRRSRKSA